MQQFTYSPIKLKSSFTKYKIRNLSRGGYNNVENVINEQCRKCPYKNNVANFK